jgi:hypothetical protein
MLLLVLNLAGTFAFGLSGGMAGVRARLDLLGVVVLAVVVGLAGGITRDLLIGVPPATIRDWRYLAVAGGAGLVTFLAHPLLSRIRRPIDVLDAAGTWSCNIWQGTYPSHNTLEDGYLGTAPVISFPPNGFGLYNVSGNVWEWCWDIYDAEVYGTYRVLRGGGWLDEHWSCRVAVRRRSHPNFRIDDVGFRIARSNLH